jgi:TonB-linked SusC/RagA family outer membrane protein
MSKTKTLILLSLMQMFALIALAQNTIADKRVTLNMTDVTVRQLFEEVRKQTGLSFIYSSELPKALSTVTLKAQNTPITQVLDDVTRQIGCTYEMEGSSVMIKARPNPREASGHMRKISGYVRDEAGEPLMGVPVSIGDEQIRSVTDMEGFYSFPIPIGATTLKFSYVGLGTEYVQIAQGNTDVKRDVVLRSDNELGGVVVTGIYNRNKESFTGSATTFDSGELKMVGNQNLLQSLKTLDPSFAIVENETFGSDPNRLPDVEVRGKTSIVGLTEENFVNPNQPLFILDGFESTLSTINDLDMDRVASITILKDAAATAIYGSKAANGVIVVETKKPEPGQLRVNYFGNFSVTYADLSDYNLMNSTEKLEFEKLSGYFGQLDENNQITDESNQMRYNLTLAEIKRGVDTYWINEPLRMAFSQKHTLFLEGGSGDMLYGVGVGYGNTQGVMKESGKDLVNGNIKLIYRKKKFSLANNLNLDYSKADRETVPFSRYARANPYFRKYNESGQPDMLLTSIEYKDMDMLARTTKKFYNPLYDNEQNNYNQTNTHGFTNNLELGWMIVEGLRARAKIGIGWSTAKGEIFKSPFLSDYVEADRLNKGQYTESTNNKKNYNGEVSLSYTKIFAQKHHLNAIIGLRFSDDKVTYSQYAVRGFIDDEFRNPSFAIGYPEGEKSVYYDTQKRSSSLFFNAGYTFDNRYLADLNLRRDGSSVFGADNHFSTTWSVGFGWNIHNEPFMKSVGWLNYFKLRASVGNPGNQNFDDYVSMRIYGYNNNYSSPFGATVYVTNLGNRGLDWQQTLDMNIGFDLMLFDSRLKCYFDYFDKITDPLLVSIGVPESTGTSTVLRNLGTQETKGVTLVLNYAIIKKNDLLWSANLNMRHMTTKYKDIGNSLGIYNNANKSRNLTRFYDGGSPYDLWAVRSNGIDPMTGREVFVNKNDNQTFLHDYDDEVVCGNTEPDVEGVIGTSFYYKGFTASINLRYRLGGQIFMNTLYNKVENITTAKMLENQDKRALYDRWQYVGHEAKFKAISQTEITPISSRFIEDNNVLSGESVSIGYENHGDWLKKIGASALTFKAYMNDFFRISTVKNERGIDYPFARSVSFSLGLRF